MAKTNNYISEWFGHRIHPVVAESATALSDQSSQACPFLSAVTQEKRECIKPAHSKGVCTISSASNGRRQDWLVCPNRALVPAILDEAAQRLFAQHASTPALVVPAPTLAREDVRARIKEALAQSRTVVAFFQEKLGGEVSLRATQRSPEISFDFTLVELATRLAHLDIGRFGILEVQTMDFHGSYRHAVKNLQDALRLHQTSFHESVRANSSWAGQGIEGPNKSNVFKRTFYQLAFKFRLGSHPECAGCILALPTAVWDSWQPHLAAPKLRRHGDRTYRIAATKGKAVHPDPVSWIYVFEPNAAAPESPNPIVVQKIIGATARELAELALHEAPDAAATGVENVPRRIRARLAGFWSEFAVP